VTRASVLLLAVVVGVPGTASAAAAATFEEVAQEASPVTDLGMLVSPFADDCRQVKRDTERARCLGVRSFLKTHLPARTFVMTREGPEALSLSDYDPRSKAFRLVVSGCLACKQPVDVGGGNGRERRLVTLKAPAKGTSASAASVALATEVARTTIAAPAGGKAGEPNAWGRSLAPRLRAEIVFRPADEPWVLGSSRGNAFKPLAVRVYDRCSGEVLYSQPPSRGPGPKGASCEAEAAAAAGTAAAAAAASEETPADTHSLAPTAINEAMGGIKGDLDACVKQSSVGGIAQMVFVVAPSGVPQAVAVEGAAAGTPVAQCLIDAAMKARFAGSSVTQRFKYPLSLKH
jgi:hypothetical protein